MPDADRARRAGDERDARRPSGAAPRRRSFACWQRAVLHLEELALPAGPRSVPIAAMCGLHGERLRGDVARDGRGSQVVRRRRARRGRAAGRRAAAGRTARTPVGQPRRVAFEVGLVVARRSASTAARELRPQRWPGRRSAVRRSRAGSALVRMRWSEVSGGVSASVPAPSGARRSASDLGSSTSGSTITRRCGPVGVAGRARRGGPRSDRGDHGRRAQAVATASRASATDGARARVRVAPMALLRPRHQLDHRLVRLARRLAPGDEAVVHPHHAARVRAAPRRAATAARASWKPGST